MMILKQRIVIAIIVCVGMFLLSATAVHGAPYTDSIKTVYHIGLDGIVKVEQSIVITRQIQETYPGTFSVGIGDKTISDVRVFSNDRDLESTVVDGEITIAIPQNIGIQEKFTLELYYTYDNFVNSNGMLHEMSIPTVMSSDDVEVTQQEISFITPQVWGGVSFASQFDRQTELTDGSIITTFKISPDSPLATLEIILGSEQWFEVDAKYTLINDQDVTVQQEIALIPFVKDYQDVYVVSIDPLPISVRTDLDDNMLALYELEAATDLTIVTKGIVRLHSVQERNENAFLTDRTSYTIPDLYWESNDDSIKNILLSENLISPEQIFNFVTQHLTYGTTRALTDDVFRFGAVEALLHADQAVCMEFTDLMIALLRAANIPAREVNGYAYFSSEEASYRPTVSDELHAWVEYWDDQHGWTFVDPTWAGTTGSDYFSQFDLRHIVFVRHGVSSQFPLPAGAYRYKTDSSQYISVLVLPEDPNQGQLIQDWAADVNKKPSSLWETWWKWILGLFGFR